MFEPERLGPEPYPRDDTGPRPVDAPAVAQEAPPRRKSPQLDRRVMRSIKSREGQILARGGPNLDSPTANALQRQLLGLYLTELEIQGPNREQMHADEEVYDNIQWDSSEEQAIREFGMVPMVANVVATTINWVLGSEKRMRTDYKILPRRKAEGAQAQRKTDYMKFVSDANFSPWAWSAAFAESVKSGIGFMEDAIQDGEGDPILCRQESWRNLVWDSAAEMDLRNGRFMFRPKWLDLDVAISIFPHRRAQLVASSIGNDAGALGTDGFGDLAMDSREEQITWGGMPASQDATYDRPRVRVIEAWFRKPTTAKVMVRGEKPGGAFIGEIYDPMSRGHWNELNSGQAIVADRVVNRTFVAHMTAEDLLHVQESPYRHNQFPFTPIWCYRRGATGQPYGMVRGLRTLQEDINRRLMKALAILSSNKTIMDAGALGQNMTLEEYADEITRPNAIIVKEPGTNLEFNVDRGMEASHLAIMSQSIGMVQSVSGVTDENLGRSTNATSGIAIGRRQDQGSLATAIIFDNLRLSKMKSGELQLSLVEQFVDEEREFRVVTGRGVADFHAINTVDPETGEVFWEDDITATKADFIISEQAWAASMRQAQVTELMELMTALGQISPQAAQVAVATLDLVVETMDIPNRDEVVKRIREITGMRDPDATELTPEEEAKQKKAQAAEDRAIRMEEATIAEKEASGDQKAAAAMLAQLQAKNAEQDEIIKRIQAQADALLQAIQAINSAQAAPVADAILRDAGYKTKTDEAINTVAAEAEAAAADEAAMAEEEAMAAEQQQPAPGGDPTQQPPQAAAPGAPMPPPGV